MLSMWHSILHCVDILKYPKFWIFNNQTTDSLEMMSLDSLKRAQLRSILEQYYGAEVEPEFIFDVNTTFDALVQKVDVGEIWGSDQ